MSQSGLINTEDYSARLRERAIRTDAREILISDLRGTDQEADLSLPPNCGGYGRIRINLPAARVCPSQEYG